MSLSALTSYSNIARQYAAPAKSSRPEQATTDSATMSKATQTRTPLSEALSPKQMERLEDLHGRKGRMSGRLRLMERQFAHLQKKLGENPQADMDKLIKIGRRVDRMVKILNARQSQISSILNQANPKNAEGIARGNGQLFDKQRLNTDYTVAERMNTLVQSMFDSYQMTKETAKQEGDTGLLNSESMRLADRHGQRLLDRTEDYLAEMRSAASNAKTVSLVV